MFDKRNEGEDENEDESDDDDTASSSQLGLPALGPAGTSSRKEDDGATSQISTDLSPDTATEATATATYKVQTFVNPKFALQYTCNVCDHRNSIIVSRKAYREGIVIAVCKGCGNKHWIADNLDPTLADNNIEEYFESRGLGDTVNRVTEEVFEIERVWGLPVEGGEITDESSGDSVLE